MKIVRSVIILSAVLASAPAFAQAAAPLKAGAYLRSSDGRRVGVIDDVAMANGAPVDAQVIVDSRIVHIPASTITANDKDHFTTSLSFKDIKAL